MSDKLKKLFEARAKSLHDMRETSDKYDGSEAFSAEDQEAYENENKRYDEITVKIDAEQSLLEREQRAREDVIPIDDTKPKDKKEDGEDGQEEYRKAFDHYMRVRGAEIPADVQMRATTDPQTVGTDADGGYLAPDEFWRQLQESRAQSNVMRGLAKTITTASGALTIPVVDSHGVAAWYDESATIVVAKETFTTATLNAYKAARIIKVTQELLNDSFFNFASYCASELGRSIGVLEEAAFVSGDGSSKPTGIFAATTGVTAASATAVTSDELMGLYHSIIAPYRAGATWMMKDATALLIRKLKDGNQQYLWQPGLQAGQPDRLLNRPVVTTENAPAATTGLDAILFGNVRDAYWIADRKGLALKRLDELYAVNDQVGFKGTIRTDGKIIDAAAVRVLTMG